MGPCPVDGTDGRQRRTGLSEPVLCTDAGSYSAVRRITGFARGCAKYNIRSHRMNPRTKSIWRSHRSPMKFLTLLGGTQNEHCEGKVPRHAGTITDWSCAAHLHALVWVRCDRIKIHHEGQRRRPCRRRRDGCAFGAVVTSIVEDLLRQLIGPHAQCEGESRNAVGGFIWIRDSVPSFRSCW